MSVQTVHQSRRTSVSGDDGLSFEWTEATPANLRSSGATRHGSWAQLIDSVRERERDRHWKSSLLVASRRGQVVGGLATHRVSGQQWPHNFLGRAVHGALPPELSPSEVMLVGGVSALRGGGVVREAHDVARTELLLAAMVSEAVRAAQDLRLHPFAPFVPGPQVPAFVNGWGQRATTHWADVWSTIELEGCSTIEDFLGALGSKVRHTWKRSFEQTSVAGWDVRLAVPTDDLVVAAAPLVASVKAGNGEPDAPELASLRVRRWRRTEGEHVAFECRGGDERLLGVTFGKVVDRRLQLAEIGMSDDDAAADRRHDVYGALVFDAPLQYALARGLRSVELGPGHPYPKRNRGAIQTPLWHITSGEQR